MNVSIVIVKKVSPGFDDRQWGGIWLFSHYYVPVLCVEDLCHPVSASHQNNNFFAKFGNSLDAAQRREVKRSSTHAAFGAGIKESIQRKTIFSL